MSISKLLFGEIALKKKLVTQEQVSECLEIQKKLKDMGISRTLGAVMHDKKYLTMVEIKEILREMTGTKDWNAIEGYEILGKLGKGGMGAVYKARHQKLNKIVALKVLPPELAGDQEYLDRFLREARAAAKLNHVNIVQALDVGESYGYHYFVMEYAEGKTVKDMIEDRGTLDEGDALDIVEQVGSALAHAAKNDLVHRDIKPSNIIVTPEGVAKLLDLGLAKSITEDQAITQTGVIMGTPFYLSPEQARSEELDPRSDIYSLGVTLFHMLTGQVPFNGNSAATILYKHIFQEPPKPKSLNPKVSTPVSEFVVRLMAKSKDDRPATCEAMIDEIAVVREKAGITQKPRGAGVAGVRGTSSASAAAVTPSSSAPPRGIDALDTSGGFAASLSEGAASTGATPSTSQALTGDQAAIGLDVSGPQAEATAEGRTEEIGATKRRGERDEKEKEGKKPKVLADLKIPSVPKKPPQHKRQLVMAGSAAAMLASLYFTWQGARALPPGADVPPGPINAAKVIADQTTQGKTVAEGIKEIDRLRGAKQLGAAADSLITLPEAALKGQRSLSPKDEYEIGQRRESVVKELELRGQSIISEYEKAKAANKETDSTVRQIKDVDLGAAEKLMSDERSALQAEMKTLTGTGAGAGGPGGDPSSQPK